MDFGSPGKIYAKPMARKEGAVKARLCAISGPLRDSTFVLPSGEIPIGRDPGNLLAISDPALSRRHCVLVADENGYQIRDLSSRNGTFVNGVPVKESALRHGDQISVGDSVLVLQLREESPEASAEDVEFDEGTAAQATAEFRAQDALYLQPERIQGELPANSKLARNLNALLRISRVVHAIRDLDQLQAQILNLIFEIVPAERGAILLNAGGEGFASMYARHRAPSVTSPVRVSRTIARRVLDQGVAILGADVQASGDGLGGVESILASNVRSLLCVPLSVFQKVIGCIYLDTTNSPARFDDDHLQLVAAVASICAFALDTARNLQWLEQENQRLTEEIDLEHNMVGESARMKQVYQFLSRVAPAESTVLLRGESGTGKELAARAIHRNSPRARKPFIAINSGAIPDDLVESELFGFERGAFTGAIAQKKGRLELAEGGIVFFDEIGELSPAVQIKLLRVLQERELERLGGTRSIPVNIRVIAATNQDLEAAVEKGKFRRDLYFRLNVLSLVMPPLRERRDDIPLLAEFFVRKYCQKSGFKPRRISPEAMACLVNYDWQGNVRELENAIEHAVVLGSSDTIEIDDLPEPLLEKEPPPGVATPKYHTAVKDRKKELIVKALEEAKGSYTEAGRLLGINPNYLHRLIKNLGLKDALRASGATAGTNPQRANGSGET